MTSELDRRHVIAGAAAVALLPGVVQAQSPSSPAHPSAQFMAAWEALARGREVKEARVALDVLEPLALRLGVDQHVLAVGVDPGEQRLRLAVGHERHDRGEVGTGGEAVGVGVEGHGGSRLSVGHPPSHGTRWSATRALSPAVRT